MFFILSLQLLISAVLIDCSNNPEPEYWNKISKESLYKSKQLFGNDSAQKAKNVILFLGDGMGMPSISAARLLKKQLKNNSDAFLIFESFSHSALIKVSFEEVSILISIQFNNQ